MIIVCGQSEMGMAFVCLECEGPLPAGGIAAEVGRVCSEDCAANQSSRVARQRRETHLNQRDLLCDCAEVCAPRGLPTAEMLQEYADYLSALEVRT